MEALKSHAELTQIFVRSESVVYREIAGEAILVPIYTRVEDADSIFTLNEVAARIWELLDGSRNLGQVADIILEEFDVSRHTAEADLLELAEKLLALGAVKEV